MQLTNIIRIKINGFLILLLVISLISNNIFSQNNDEYKIKTVVIDAGHGGKDPGAVCKIGYEKDIVLSIALKLGEYIKENLKDVKVIYTRDTDVFVELHKRAKIANTNKADLFISLHANANESQKPYGSETFVMGLSKTSSNLAVAKKENAVVLKEDDYQAQYDGFDPNSIEGNIIFSLYQNMFLSQSLDFSGRVQTQFRERVGRHDRGVKQANFLVLWKTTMPSVLVEVGFISNPKEAKFLFSEQGQDYIASAIFRAFRDYKESFEKNNKQTYTAITQVAVPNDSVKEKQKETFYSIQLLSSSKQITINNKNFPGLTEVFEKEELGMYKYYCYTITNYKEIKNLQNNVNINFKGAFIVGFDHGKKISAIEVKKKLKN